MTAKLDKANERKLLSAIDTVVSRTDEGEDLHGSCCKVAAEQGFSDDMVRLLCRSYNAGAVNYQREKQATGVLNKLAKLELLDPEQVIQSLHGEKTASVTQPVSDVYASPFRAKAPVIRSRQKQASTDRTTTTPREVMSVAEFAGRARELLKQARQEIVPVKLQFLRDFGVFADAVKVAGIKDAELLGACQLLDPAYGESTAKAVISRNNGTDTEQVKLAAESPTFLLDTATAPFCYFPEVIKAAREYNQATQEYAKSAIQVKVKIAELVEGLTGENKSVLPVPVKWNKIAGDLATYVLGSNLARVGADSLVKSPEDRESKVQSEMDSLNDPAHTGEMRKYQVEAMMHDLMNNDEVLRGYKPEQIATAYNELARMSPRVAQQPMLARSILRKIMPQGGVDTFEANDIASTEKTLAQTNAYKAAAPRNPLFGGSQVSDILRTTRATNARQ